MNTTLTNRTSQLEVASSTSRVRAAVVLTGVAYLGAWLIGLVAAPPSPGAFAPSAEVHAFFAEHGGAALRQSLLVHGAAGLALAGWVIATARLVGPRRRTLTRVGVVAGLSAAALSLTQLTLQVKLARHAVEGTAQEANWFFDAINRLDSLKLLALAVLVAAFTSATWRTRRSGSVVGMGAVLAPLLPVSGVAFLADSAFLTGLLYLSLPLLLAWVATVTTTLYRHNRTPTRRAT